MNARTKEMGGAGFSCKTQNASLPQFVVLLFVASCRAGIYSYH